MKSMNQCRLIWQVESDLHTSIHNLRWYRLEGWKGNEFWKFGEGQAVKSFKHCKAVQINSNFGYVYILFLNI